MQAVIMAGGKGSRLVSVTNDLIPKPMALIAGKPLLEWQIESLIENNIQDIIIIIGHLGEKIQEYFGNGERFGCRVSYIKETVPLGTAGAFYYLKDYLREKQFLLVFGDVLFRIDIQRMVDFHAQKHALATLFVHPNNHPYDSDLIECGDDQKIVALHSKKEQRDSWYDNCVNAGIYLFDSAICEQVLEPIKMDLEKDILVPMINAGEAVFGYRSPEYVKDIGTVERICSAEEDLKGGIVEKRCLKNPQSCIFLDRDGTLNQYKGLITQDEDFILEKNAALAVKAINKSGYLAIVATNQPVVARGLCSIEDVRQIHRKLATLLGQEGSYLDDIFFCPHHPDNGYPEENPEYKIPCRCRKPGIGMIQEAAERYNIDLTSSWIIGDTTTDIQTGKNAGLRTALVLTGEGGKDHKFQVEPDLTCNDIFEAVTRILEDNL